MVGFLQRFPSRQIGPAGWVPNAQTWLPAKPPSSQPQFVHVLNKEIQSRNDGDTINQSKPYSGGIGGPCEVFDPPCAALPLLCWMIRWSLVFCAVMCRPSVRRFLLCSSTVPKLPC